MKGKVRALEATQDEMRSKDVERNTSEAWLRSLQADWNGWRAYLDSNGKMDGLSQAVWNSVGSSEQEPTDGLARGMEVNRFPASLDYVDDDTAHSSPNNAMSSFQMEFGIGSVSCGQSKRYLEETDAQKEGSRDGNDDDDNESSLNKLCLSKEPSTFLEESFKEHSVTYYSNKMGRSEYESTNICWRPSDINEEVRNNSEPETFGREAQF